MVSQNRERAGRVMMLAGVALLPVTRSDFVEPHGRTLLYAIAVVVFGGIALKRSGRQKHRQASVVEAETRTSRGQAEADK